MMIQPQCKANLFLEMFSSYANYKKVAVVLLHTPPDQHRMEVHFLGSSLEALADVPLCSSFSFLL